MESINLNTILPSSVKNRIFISIIFHWNQISSDNETFTGLEAQQHEPVIETCDYTFYYFTEVLIILDTSKQ